MYGKRSGIGNLIGAGLTVVGLVLVGVLLWLDGFSLEKYLPHSAEPASVDTPASQDTAQDEPSSGDAIGSESIVEQTGPVVFWASDPVLPDEAVTVIGSGFTQQPVVEIASIDNVAASKPTSELSWPGGGDTVAAIQPGDQSFRFIVPAGMKPGVYVLRISTADGTALHLINTPQIWWVQGDLGTRASPGGWIRAFGKNLRVPSKAEKDVVTSIRLEGPTTVDLSADSNAFSAQIDLPASLPVGQYRVVLDSGEGSAVALSRPASITVQEPVSWPATKFNVKDFGAVGDGVKDDTLVILAALQKAEKNGGGIVYFPRGRYKLSEGLQVPRFTVLCGEKREWVALCWTDKTNPPDAMVKGTNSFGLTDLTLYAHGHRNVIVGDLGTEPDAGNVFLHRVLVRADMYRGQLSPEEVAERWQRSLSSSSDRAVDTVHLGGENIEITDCNFYGSGRSLFLSRVRSGLVARNQFYNGRWGWYCISGSNGLIFEQNSVTGGDLMSSGGGLNCLDGSNSSENVYYAENKLRLLHGWDREAMTSDAGGGMYFGKIASVDGIQMTFAQSPKAGGRNCIGAGVFILDGRGAGQYRRVVARHGSSIEIDKPWTVIPDRRSDVSITMFQGRYILLNNECVDTGQMQFYGTSIECFAAGNHGTRMRGFSAMGRWYHGGYQPSWYCQFLENEILEGNYYHWNTGTDAHIEVFGNRYDLYDGPLNRGAVVRRNRLQSNAQICITGTCRDVLVEGNHVANSDQGIVVGTSVENTLVRNNTFENVVREVQDERSELSVAAKK